MLKWRNICCSLCIKGNKKTFLIHFSKHVLVSFLRVLKRLHHNTITQQPWDPARFIFMFYFCECAPLAPSPNCQTLQINWGWSACTCPPVHWFRDINSSPIKWQDISWKCSKWQDTPLQCQQSDSLWSDRNDRIRTRYTGWPCSCINLCVYLLI